MAENFRFPEENFDYAAGGPKTKTRNNIQAIRLLKTIEQEERQATPAEQQILVQYVGWGGIPQIFNPTPDQNWANEAAELKEILELEEWNNAFESTLNAHYTSPQVIQNIYQGLEQLGFSGGRILEPSMGTGNFLGLMPKDIADRSTFTGVELDSITGRIARQLYPNAEIHVQGFQDTSLPKDYFDLAISNVPFGDYKIHDPEFNHLDLRVHNYFIARSLDRVRPGGLVAVLTSSGTMQAKSSHEFRAYLSERANLVGAMRLPGNAFKSNAGTEVTTDLIILQKLGSGVEPNHEPWIDVADTTVQDAEGNFLQTNEYYVRHPDRMLGDISDDKLYPGRLALVADGRDMPQAMQETFAQFPRHIYQKRIYQTELENTLRVKLPPDVTVKNFGYVAQGDIIWQRRGDWLEPTDFKGKRAERIKGMLEIRDAVQDVFDVQIRGGLDDELGIAQAKLNQVYDQFVAKNGNLSDSANKRVFNLDPDAQLILALEQKNKNTDAVEKTAVFSSRTVRPKEVRASAETSQEALVTSLNEYNQVVPGYMAQLVGKDEAVVLADLQQQGLIFKDPTTEQWQTEDHYLSGEVRDKLKLAQTAVEEGKSEFQANVDALLKVQPRDLGPGEIEVRLGSPWIPPETIADFAHDLLQVPKENGGITVNHSSNFAVWSIKAIPSIQSNSHNLKTYGTGYYSAIELIEKSLNLKDVSVFYKDADGKSRVDQQATMSVRMKQEQIKERFKGWIWKDFDRSQKLCKIYNDLFNGTVIREFRNPNLEMPGSSPSITLRPHQKDAVWRSLQSPTTLLAHEVGAGKTFTMVASAIEMRRLGIAKKPMIVVPNHMLEQFTNEFQQLYPNAKVLAPGEKDTKASKRKELMARIATGDWDAVIVTHSAFKLLPISKEQEKDFYVQQLTEVESVINEQGDRKGNAIVKQLARERRKLQERIETITKSDKRDDGVLFDQLGVDALFVDEAHFWKNLGRPSKLENITGLSNTNSQRAMDGFMKCQLVRKQGGRLVFATGTPISNSIAEMYTMQRFLQPEALERQGIGNFDAWVGNFAEKVTAPEIDATGQFKVKTRLARFTNVPELMTLFRETADIKTTEQLNLPVPQVERITVATQASEVQLSYMEHLISRAEAVASRAVKPTHDNMLLITTDGRRSALDMRLVSPAIPDHSQSKASQAITNIHHIWESTAENRLTQMVFCDLGTPKKAKAGEEGRFSLYADIKAGLIAKGIPAEEIAFIHDAANNKQKEELYGKMRKGDVRVLIGSSEKCAVGMNIQDRLIAEHHLDAPWRPSDIAQREGRIIRQGNRNSKVIVMTYVTQGRNGQLGFDSYSWQTLARKAEMVGQVMNGDPTLRSVDDISGAALSFDEIKAIATGNPLIMEKATVDNRVTELSRYQQAFLNERYDTQREIKDFIPERIKNVTQRIDALTADIPIRQDTSGDKFKIKIGNKTLDKRQDAGQLLLNIIGTINKKDKKGEQKIGEFAGFDLMAFSLDRFKTALNLRSPNGNSYYISGGESPLGIIRSMESSLSKLPENLEEEKKSLARINSELSVLEESLDKPFEYEVELEQQLARQHEINTELGIYKDDKQSIIEEIDESEGEEESLDKAQPEEGQEEENDQLIDLDDLDSIDANLDWLDNMDREEVYAPSRPTPELIAALQNLGTFAPDPKQEIADLDPSIEPDLDIIETPQAQTVDPPPEDAPTPKIPESVIEGLTRAIAAIESFNEAIEAGRYLDQQQGGQGRYEFESFENRSASIDQAQETIASFRAKCPEKGIDAEQVLTELGYVPPLEMSEAAKEWVRQPEGEPVVEPTPIVQGEDEQMSLFQAQEQPQEPLAEQTQPTEIEKKKRIAPPTSQTGKAEQYAAQFLHEAGLAQEFLRGEDFHLTIENGPYIPLVVERHADQMYLTHYSKDQSGELFIDSEMVFSINEGKLKLEQTAVQNPFTGGEARGLDRPFGDMFTKNIIDQGFAEAAAKQSSEVTQETQTEEVNAPEPVVMEEPVEAPTQSESLQSEEMKPTVEQIAPQPPPEQNQAQTARDIEALNLLRHWYWTAQQLSTPDPYLEAIAGVAEKLKAGQSLSNEAIQTMQRDFRQLDLYHNTSQAVSSALAHHIDPTIHFTGTKVTVEQAKSIRDAAIIVLNKAGVQQTDGTIQFTGKQFSFHQAPDRSLLILMEKQGAKIPMYYNGQFSNRASPVDKQTVQGIPQRLKQSVERAKRQKAQQSRQQKPKPNHRHH